MGVGDRVPEAIAQLGAEVQLLGADAVASGDLSRFNAIMIGVRAYERRPDLRANNQRLLDYAENGGTVIVQYQRTEFNDAQYGPYPAKTSDARVTDENAPMEPLVPDDPVFTHAEPDRAGDLDQLGAGAGHLFHGRSAIRVTSICCSSHDPVSVQCGTQDRDSGRSARRQGTLVVYRTWPLAPAARRRRWRLSSPRQSPQPGKAIA